LILEIERPARARKAPRTTSEKRYSISGRYNEVLLPYESFKPNFYSAYFSLEALNFLPYAINLLEVLFPPAINMRFAYMKGKFCKYGERLISTQRTEAKIQS
jgi:hypothetical protein